MNSYQILLRASFKSLIPGATISEVKRNATNCARLYQNKVGYRVWFVFTSLRILSTSSFIINFRNINYGDMSRDKSHVCSFPRAKYNHPHHSVFSEVVSASLREYYEQIMWAYTKYKSIGGKVCMKKFTSRVLVWQPPYPRPPRDIQVSMCTDEKAVYGVRHTLPLFYLSKMLFVSGFPRSSFFPVNAWNRESNLPGTQTLKHRIHCCQANPWKNFTHPHWEHFIILFLRW